MKVYVNPPKQDWNNILARPVFAFEDLEKKVVPILNQVRTKGDSAIRKFTRQFDGIDLEGIQIQEKEISIAIDQMTIELKEAILVAKENIEKFHAAQQEDTIVVETMPGVKCWRSSVAIERVGLYIPGGTAPLFSTILMLGIPAKIAGCKEIILCTPPQKDGNIHPAILYTAHEIGIDKIFKVGGAQAVGAMAYGTESIPSVYKIFGPGNQFVTMAKQLVNKEGIAIDMPAGPSEVLVYADETSNPSFVAADLLSQAEHGVDSQVVLVTTSESQLEKIQEAIQRQLVLLPRKSIAEKALNNSVAIVVDTVEVVVQLINQYAPEHLILAVDSAMEIASRIINAGSVFLGHFTPESIGDYASGTNHTLPTNGFAKMYSGVSLDSFVKKITYQKLEPKGLQILGPVVEKMAEAEALVAHKHAVTIRLNQLR